MQVRKVIKNRGHFPNDDAACKLIYLALRNITRDWKMPPREWKAAMTQFAIQFEGRFPRQCVEEKKHLKPPKHKIPDTSTVDA